MYGLQVLASKEEASKHVWIINRVPNYFFHVRIYIYSHTEHGWMKYRGKNTHTHGLENYHEWSIRVAGA